MRPDPTIIRDPSWGSPRCVVCGGVFYGDQWQSRVDERTWRVWRIWRRRWRHAHC